MMFEKLKKLNKKWYLLLVLVIVLGGGGGLAAKFYMRQQHQINMQANVAAQMARSVEQDLLYLDSISTLKLTPDQAKAILPLIEKMPASNATSSPTTSDLAKQVYETLTPSQYQALTDHGKSISENIENHGQDDKKGNRQEDKQGDNRKFDNPEHSIKGVSDPKTDALNDIVIKMLKDRSIEIPKNPVS